jgi:hypothetical protein
MVKYSANPSVRPQLMSIYQKTFNRPTLLYIYLLGLSMASSAIPIASHYIKFDWLFGGIICIYGLYQRISGKSINGSALKFAILILLCLVLNGIIASIKAKSFYLTSGLFTPGYFSYFSQYVFALSIFAVVSSFKLRTAHVYNILDWWVIIAAVACLLAVIQVALGDMLVDRFLFTPYYRRNILSTKIVAGIFAPSAWFGESSWFGSFLVVPVTYTFYLLVAHPFSLQRVISLFALMAGIFLGYSLTATLTTIVGFCSVLAIQGRFHLLQMVFLCIGCVTSYFLFPTALLNLYITRFAQLFLNLWDFKPGSQSFGMATSFSDRSLGFAKAFSDFIENPFFGIGIGQSDRAYHSGFLTILAEQGLVGVFANYAIVVYVLFCLFGIRKTADMAIKNLSSCFIALMIADYANGFITHNAFHLQRWILISIIMAWFFYLRKNGLLGDEIDVEKKRTT